MIVTKRAMIEALASGATMRQALFAAGFKSAGGTTREQVKRHGLSRALVRDVVIILDRDASIEHVRTMAGK